MAVYTRYVDCDAVAGGDGQSLGVVDGTHIDNDGSGHRPYSGLNAWVAAEQDTSGATDDDIVYCGSQTSAHTADTPKILVDGWVTEKTSGSIQIIGDMTSGVWDATKYRIQGGCDSHRLMLYESYIVISRIQVCATDHNWDSNGGIGCSDVETTHDVQITRCIIKSTCTAGQGAGTGNAIHLRLITSGIVVVQNNVTYGTFLRGMSCYAATGTATWHIDNNLAYGVSGAGQMHINEAPGATMYSFNNISYATGGNSYAYTGLHASSANDLSDDAFSPDTSHRNKTLTFANVSTGTEDFHLVAADTDAIGLGSDRSSRFTIDITGATRTTWDIGAFLYVEEETGQFARPVSDVAAGGWTASTGSDLYAMVDESAASDADYITSGAAPAADTAVMTLGTLSTPVAGTVTLRIRAKYN